MPVAAATEADALERAEDAAAETAEEADEAIEEAEAAGVLVEELAWRFSISTGLAMALATRRAMHTANRRRRENCMLIEGRGGCDVDTILSDDACRYE